MPARRQLAIALLAAWTLWIPTSGFSQSLRKGGVEFNALRLITVPAGKSVGIVVSEFFHHGEVSAKGGNVLVYGVRTQQPVSTRVLQVGPGDLCRVAFQASGSQHGYEILYGGPDLPAGLNPPWTSKEGLLLETREYTRCDLSSADAVREAFDKARPIGADYVEGVFQSYNPCTLEQKPFMSHYSGTLTIELAGKYGLFTSSQDCSFMFLDGKLVASAPGRQRASHRATPDLRRDVQLSAGPHAFDYYHVATTTDTLAVAAWEVGPVGRKPEKVVPIPSECFHTKAVARAVPESPVTAAGRVTPDFLAGIEGSAPLPDSEAQMVLVRFKDNSPKPLTTHVKVLWEFGDGQTSDQADPTHVYLLPGLYTVKFSVLRPPKPVQMVNRVYVAAPVTLRTDSVDTFNTYLPILAKYDASKLPATHLARLVAAFDAKVAQVEAGESGTEETRVARRRRGKRGANTPEDPEPSKKEEAEEIAARHAEAAGFVQTAVNLAQAGLAPEAVAQGDAELLKVARLTGSMARDHLGQADAALSIWKGAAAKIKSADLKAECQVEAAAIAIDDLLKPQAGKPLLDAAAKVLESGRPGPVKAAYFCTLGDYYAATGDGNAARKAYLEAEAAVAATKNFIQRTAWRGAYNRSAEEFVKDSQFDRAAVELRRWERDFPGEKIDGLWFLMTAQYWSGRQLFDQAVAVCEQLLNVNRDSPYADQLLFLAAQCEQKRGKNDRASATYHSLVTDYPGSPLVPKAKEAIARLESGTAEPAKKPTKKK